VTLNAFHDNDDDNNQPVPEAPEMLNAQEVLDSRDKRRVSEEFADAQPVRVLSLAECAEPYI
jgi:hypothetical protein